jgi:outer membrane protein OmpA-like peptidoglycan-associated protein
MTMKKIFVLLLLFSFVVANAQDSLTVYFDFDQSALKSSEKTVLANYFSQGKPITGVAIYGHCDQLGTDDYNDKLSLQRAQTVQQFIARFGVYGNVISETKGFGKRMLVQSATDAKARQQNRRVTIVVTIATVAVEKETAVPPVDVPVAPKKEAALKEVNKENIDSAQAGEKLLLKHINFYGGRHIFLPQAMPALNELLAILKERPNLVIEIQGHICCGQLEPKDGMDIDTNERALSLNRAKAVYNYLVLNGIDEERLTYKGFGYTQPIINPEITEADKTTNRRVEIKIIKK